MPHKCANCEETYPDGSDEILSGCSSCGGNKFQFVPATQPDEEEVESVSSGRDVEGAMTPQEPTTQSQTTAESNESNAQQTARSTMVSSDELPSKQDGSEGEATENPTDKDAVREALNRQFESIRIVSQGEYELDLMKLYNREDHVISLFNDGKYAIHINED